MRTMQDVVAVKDLAAYGEELTEAEMVTVMGGDKKEAPKYTVTFLPDGTIVYKRL